MLIESAISDMGACNQDSRKLETQLSRSLRVLVHRLALRYNQQQKSSYSNNWVKVILLGNFCGCNGKTSTICHRWSRLISPLKQGSYSATDSTCWDTQACTHDTLCRQHYITTSKEYLINSHILLAYLEFVFPQLQLVKILCKLMIIGVNYERKKKEKGVPIYETPYTYSYYLPCNLCFWWHNARQMFRKRWHKMPFNDSTFFVHFILYQYTITYS